MAHEFWPEAERRVAAWVANNTQRNGDMTPELLLDLYHRLCASEAAVAALQEAVGALAEAVTLLSAGDEATP